MNQNKFVGKTTTYKAGAGYQFSSQDESINLILEVNFGNETKILCEDCCYHSLGGGSYSHVPVKVTTTNLTDWKECTECAQIFRDHVNGVYFQHRRWLHSSGFPGYANTMEEWNSLKSFFSDLDLNKYFDISDSDLSKLLTN
jgi:hypothetical protein